MWILLYRFHRIYASGRPLLNYANSFCPNDYKKNDKIIYKYFHGKPQVWIRKYIYETRNCLLEEIKQNDLMSEKHKKRI